MELKYINQGWKLTVEMPPRVDTGNISEVQSALQSVLDKNGGVTDLVLDCSVLTYISSVGLRLLLSLRKTYQKMVLTKVNQEIFDILDMTGFSSILDIERA